MNSANSAFDKQEGGSHYKDLKIQPMEYALANNLNYAQANSIKYITRYKAKNGLEDLKKAIHCLELLISYEYGESDMFSDRKTCQPKKREQIKIPREHADFFRESGLLK